MLPIFGWMMCLVLLLGGLFFVRKACAGMAGWERRWNLLFGGLLCLGSVAFSLMIYQFRLDAARRQEILEFEADCAAAERQSGGIPIECLKF